MQGPKLQPRIGLSSQTNTQRHVLGCRVFERTSKQKCFYKSVQTGCVVKARVGKVHVSGGGLVLSGNFSTEPFKLNNSLISHILLLNPLVFTMPLPGAAWLHVECPEI